MTRHAVGMFLHFSRWYRIPKLEAYRYSKICRLCPDSPRLTEINQTQESYFIFGGGIPPSAPPPAPAPCPPPSRLKIPAKMRADPAGFSEPVFSFQYRNITRKTITSSSPNSVFRSDPVKAIFLIKFVSTVVRRFRWWELRCGWGTLFYLDIVEFRNIVCTNWLKLEHCCNLYFLYELF